MTAPVVPALWLTALLGPSVVAHEAPDASLVGDLWPGEEAHVARAVPARRQEFAAGRACARAGCVALGREPAVIPVGQHRAPVWPPGIVGSVSHSAGWCIAAVASLASHSGIGIDIEVGRVSVRILPMVLTKAERDLAVRCSDPALHATVVFSAKESIYKALSAAGTHDIAAYDNLEVEVGPGLFRGRLVHRPSVRPLTGQWTRRRDAVVTALALPPTKEQP